MYNLGRSGSDTGLFRSVFICGWGSYGVGLYARPFPPNSLRVAEEFAFPGDTCGSTKLGQWC